MTNTNEVRTELTGKGTKKSVCRRAGAGGAKLKKRVAQKRGGASEMERQMLLGLHAKWKKDGFYEKLKQKNDAGELREHIERWHAKGLRKWRRAHVARLSCH